MSDKKRVYEPNKLTLIIDGEEFKGISEAKSIKKEKPGYIHLIDARIMFNDKDGIISIESQNNCVVMDLTLGKEAYSVIKNRMVYSYEAGE